MNASILFYRHDFRYYGAWLFVLLAIVLTVVSVSSDNYESHKKTIFILEAISCIFFAYYSPKIEAKKKYENEIERKAYQSIADFRELFRELWAGWLIYYIILLINNKETLGQVFEPFLKNYLSMIIVLCYLRLNYVDISNIKINGRHRIKYFILVLSFSFAHYIWLSSSLQENIAPINLIAKTITSTIRGIVFALLASRLLSKRIDLPDFFVMVLIIYALLQPFSILSSVEGLSISNYEVRKTTLGQIANLRYSILLAGKSFIFMCLLWLYRSKMLLNYFKAIPETEKATDIVTQRNQRLEITEEIKKLVSGNSNKLEKALGILLDNTEDSTNEKTILNLQGHLTEINQSRMRGTIDDAVFLRETAIIRQNTLCLLDLYREETL